MAPRYGGSATLSVTMPTRTPIRRRRPFWPVVAAALATFLAVLALLTYQVRSGRDPALGRGVAVIAVDGRTALVSRTSGAAATSRHGTSVPAVAPLRSHTSGAGGEDD